MSRFDAYVICTSPRSGSTLLCRLLGDTHVAGHPDSHFHEPSKAAWLVDYGLDARAYPTPETALRAIMEAARRRGKGAGDVFGLRLQRHSFAYFMEQLQILHPAPKGDRPRMEAAFGKTLFIHLTRQSNLDQAISYVKASQSGLWHQAPDGSEIERLSAPQAPFYDAKAITEWLDRFIAMDAAWGAWFAAQGIAPLRITYDDLSADPSGTRTRVLDALGVEFSPAEEEPLPLAKLADASNEAWAARFRSERRTEGKAL